MLKQKVVLYAPKKECTKADRYRLSTPENATMLKMRQLYQHELEGVRMVDEDCECGDMFQKTICCRKMSSLLTSVPLVQPDKADPSI